MARIPYPDPETLDERVKMIVGGAAPLNLVKVMAHAPGNVESVLRLSDAVLNRGQLDAVTRQVALIRLCVVLGSDYERFLLESVSRGVGMSDALIAEASEGSSNMQLIELHRMAARLAEELAKDVRPTAATYDYLARELPLRELVELVQAIGFYLMQARTIETFAVEVENPPVDLSRRMETVDLAALEEWRQGRR